MAFVGPQCAWFRAAWPQPFCARKDTVLRPRVLPLLCYRPLANCRPYGEETNRSLGVDRCPPWLLPRGRALRSRTPLAPGCGYDLHGKNPDRLARRRNHLVYRLSRRSTRFRRRASRWGFLPCKSYPQPGASGVRERSARPLGRRAWWAWVNAKRTVRFLAISTAAGSRAKAKPWINKGHNLTPAQCRRNKTIVFFSERFCTCPHFPPTAAPATPSTATPGAKNQPNYGFAGRRDCASPGTKEKPFVSVERRQSRNA